jgi:hypothetical protein
MGIRDLTFRDFSGGLNLRDSASELSADEFPFSWNVTIDERGYVQKRLGYADRYGAQVGAGLVSQMFYWGTQSKLVKQIGASLHADGGSAFHTFSTSDRCGMCEFAGNLFFTHPVDGAFIYSGSGSATAVPSAPKGNACATWQNKVWSNDVTADARLWKSDAADATTWGPTSYIDIREKDSAKLTCFAGASGIDISGRPGFLVFKEDSAYRVNDPSSGVYTTIDAAIGCGSNIGAVNAYGRTYVVSSRGIYSTDGLNPMREESRLIETLFNKNQINQNRADLFAAGRYQDRLYFSVPRSGETANSIAIELQPDEKWLTLHSNAASVYASIGKAVTDMAFGSPVNNGRIYNSHTGGSDAGVAISSQFQTRWAEPADGKLARLRSSRVVGRGTFSADVFKDYRDGSSQAALAVNIQPGGAIWDDVNSRWDDPDTIYGPLYFQSYQDFYSLGTCRAVSVMFSETSSSSIDGRTIAGGAVPVEVGAWTLAYISFLTFDLGMR